MVMKRRLSKHIPVLAISVLLFELMAFPHSSIASTAVMPDIQDEGVMVKGSQIKDSALFSWEEYAALQGFEPTVEGVLPQSLPQTESLALRVQHTVVITAYSSTVDQTDGDPWTTASGTRVKDGIIAANFLTFGTRVRIPALFGDKVFYVTDRMHPRFSDRVDVWMTTREEALHFGAKVATIEVYE